MDYGNAKTNLRKLLDMNLLEHDQSIADSIRNDNKSKKIKYYRLSEYGIYNLISSNRNMQFDIAKPLLLNCKDHILFGFFLFPYIKEDTLSKQEIDSLIFSEIFSYLHDCCKHLEQMIFDINHTGNQINGYLTRQLFVWSNVPQIDSDRENLRDFLKRTFNLDWLNNARIEKPDDNCITASYELNTIMIRIDRDLKNVTLSFRGRKKSELVARELTDGQFVADVVLAEPLQVKYAKTFLISHMGSIPRFILSLISHYNPAYLSPTMEILGQDERFVQVLKKTKHDFDRKYRLIVEKRKTRTKAHCSDLLFSSF